MTYFNSLPKDLLNELAHFYLPTIEITKDSRNPCEILTKNLIITNIHHVNVIDNIKCVEAENIFYDYCDKYVTKTLLKTPSKFNNVQNIYINSSPANASAFGKMYDWIPGLIDHYTNIAEPDGYYLLKQYQHLRIYIDERFERYYKRWWTTHENMFVIPHKEYQETLENAKSYLRLY